MIDIKDEIGEYTFDQVNCIENPIRIVFESFTEGIGSIFLMFVKLQYAYNLVKFNDLDLEVARVLQRIEKVLDKELGLKISRINGENFFENIEALIDENNLVLVIGNLKELFYSKHYKSSDWIHLFLIKGYDSDKQIFYVVDCAQYRENGIQNYHEFIITYETMYKMYTSWNENRYYEDILYIDKKELDKLQNRNLFIEFLQEYLYGMAEQACVECSVVEKILAGDKPIKYSERLMKVFHAKEVLYNEIKKYIKDFYVPDELFLQYLSQQKQLLMVSKRVANKLMFLLYKSKKEEIYEELEILYTQEKKMHLCINQIFLFLKEHKSNFKVVEHENIFENNKDEIITLLENGVYLFDFPNNRIYNSWDRDEAPKVICRKGIRKNDELGIKAKITIKEYQESDKFFVGLFVRTSKRALYTWGNNCGLSLRFEHAGVEANIYETLECRDSIYLKLLIKDNKCILGYSIDGINYYNHEIEETLDGEIQEIGVLGKTWECEEKILIEISDLISD